MQLSSQPVFFFRMRFSKRKLNPFVCLFVLIGVSILPRMAIAGWAPITGIPEPSFGITQEAPSTPSPWTADANGFYYICPSCAGATDAERTYGNPTAPRASIPNPIPAGSVVELHGIYNGDSLTISPQGTAESPVFIRGITGSEPQIHIFITIQGKYCIVENVIISPTDVNDAVFGLATREGSNHIVIRDSEFSGNLNKAGGIGIGSWSYAGTDSVSEILLDNLNIHDLGDPGTTLDQDKHCVTVNGSVSNLWLVNSELARCSGDGIQIEAQQGKRDKIHHVYVGNNISHDHVQTGAWVKHATDVIISQNTFYGAINGPYTAGGGTGMQYGPEYVWFLNNILYNNNIGIFIASDDPPGDGTELFIIGNLIYNTHSATKATDPYNSGCMSIRGSTNRYIVNNTCYDYDSGLNGIASSGIFFTYNNIFSKRTNNSTYDIYIPNANSASSEVKNTIFYSTDGLRINWNGSTKTTLESFQALGKGQYCLVSDPKFKDPVNNDFTIMNSSPAIDTGVDSIVNTIFKSRYGFDLQKDINGVVRQSGKIDIGAYEFDDNIPIIQSIQIQ